METLRSLLDCQFCQLHANAGLSLRFYATPAEFWILAQYTHLRIAKHFRSKTALRHHIALHQATEDQMCDIKHTIHMTQAQ